VETLLTHGALDAWVAPVTLKKSRPGHVLSVLVSGTEREAVVRRLLTESPTLGVRAWPVSELCSTGHTSRWRLRTDRSG
jgi:uncharacterized protein (DUF111 family)